jgi:hypothetical protein
MACWQTLAVTRKTALKRRTPLKRSNKGLGRRQPLARSTKPIQRKAKLKPVSTKKHKVEIREQDKLWQQEMTNGKACAVGKDCVGDLVAHHVKRRRHLATRHDPANALVLCYGHHSELHTIGEKTFRKKYGLEKS